METAESDPGSENLSWQSVCPEVLVADDSPDDLALLLRAFKAAGLTAPAQFFRGGAEVIGLLRECCQHGFHPLLLLLDLKMPSVSGLDVLRWARSRPELSEMTIVMLSHSEHDDDIRMATEMGANDYWIKPATFGHWVELVHKLKNVVQQLESTPALHWNS